MTLFQKLNNCNEIPVLGCKCSFLFLTNFKYLPLFLVGTYRMKTIEELRPVVYEAIRCGYRLIGKHQ
jgi:diketogulonate reductase-like aldo/keto reductase